MLIKRSIHAEIKSLIFTKWYVLCTTLLQNLFFFFISRKHCMFIQSPGLQRRDIWWAFLDHQSDSSSSVKSIQCKYCLKEQGSFFFFFFSISCNIIYWSSCSFFIGSIFIFFSLRISSPDMPSRDTIFLKRMEKHL